MDRYPPIAEHGLIGDLQTAVLVGTDGTVDWFCCPRFDIAAEGDNVVVRQLYFPDTAILVTRFMTPEGVGEVLDFMPVEDPQQATDRHRLVRMVRCVRGELRFVFECAPRFDYGRQEHHDPIGAPGPVHLTARFWRGWLARSTYRGRQREMVGRSAITWYREQAFTHLLGHPSVGGGGSRGGPPPSSRDPAN